MARNFTLVKNIGGMLVVRLESYDFTLPAKEFIVNHGVDRISIPYPYALGIFVSPGAKKMFEEGDFKIVEEAELLKAAESEGLVSSSQKPDKVYTKEEVQAAITKNDAKKIDAMIKSGNPVVIANIITCAQAFYEHMSQDVVRLIEDACGVELFVE